MAYTRYPTPYSDVNAVLDELLSGVKQVLGPRFVSMYLGGSLATGVPISVLSAGKSLALNDISDCLAKIDGRLGVRLEE